MDVVFHDLKFTDAFLGQDSQADMMKFEMPHDQKKFIHPISLSYPVITHLNGGHVLFSYWFLSLLKLNEDLSFTIHDVLLLNSPILN